MAVKKLLSDYVEPAVSAALPDPLKPFSFTEFLEVKLVINWFLGLVSVLAVLLLFEVSKFSLLCSKYGRKKSKYDK